MITQITRNIDPETGVNFINTAHLDDSGGISTDRFASMLDQLANAALLRQEAGWLKVMLEHEMGNHDPEIKDTLQTATARGANISARRSGEAEFPTDFLPKALRRIEPNYVYILINTMLARADEQQAWSDFNAVRLGL